MEKERCLLSCLKENKKVVNKKRRHAERAARRVSASHLVFVLESGEIPNQYHQTPDKDLPGRGQAVKAAVWNDSINNSGFTLIELLVVVLIIGILAAVALPQYQLAVAKARVNRLLPLMKSIENAQEVYKMANGNYANDWSVLDIDFPAGTTISSYNNITHPKFVCTGGINSGQYNSLYCGDSVYSVRLERYYRSHTICWAGSDTLSQKICKYLCQTSRLSSGNGCKMLNFSF